MSGQPDAVNELLERSKAAAGPVGFGGFMGYCSGMAFRRVGKAAGAALGLTFIGAQALQSSGYINVNWDKVEKEVFIKPLDANEDGKVDLDDAQMFWLKYKAMLTENVPSAGGFSAGFMLGARR